ncbi:MAG: efflux RND transporter permease subunit, partial [Planctomycetes bacterium]|nr:efflux RND transporter permease subunit [Planctomycetota bacterium]
MQILPSNPVMPEPQGLYRAIVRRPVAVTMVALTFAVFGYTSHDSLALALMPDLSYPTITVRTAYPSADPAQVERDVSERVEERVAAVPDLIGRSSVSKSDMSEVTLEFAWGTDMIRATAAVSEALERTSFSNPRIERPQVLRYDPAQDPIVRLMLFTNERQPDMAELRAYAEDILKPELSKLSGVAAVNVLGGVERQVRIYPDEDKLKQYSLSVTGIVAAVRNAGVDQSAGLIVSGDREVLLRVANVYSTQEMLEDLEIVTPAGERIRLGELAKIEIAHKEPETITRYASPVGGFESRAGVLLEILKEGDANILDAA